MQVEWLSEDQAQQWNMNEQTYMLQTITHSALLKNKYFQDKF